MKMILAETASGRPITVYVHDVPVNAYMSTWSSGETVWATHEQAQNAQGLLRADGEPVIEQTSGPYHSGEVLVKKEGYTAHLEGVDWFRDWDHVKEFYAKWMRDPVVLEISEE